MKLKWLSITMGMSLLTIAASQAHCATHEHREHGAHVHGVATLTLALAEHELAIEFDSPAVNLIGFEHAPHDAKDQQAIDRAAHVLNSPLTFLQLPPAAHCAVTKITVASELIKSTSKAGATNTDHDSHHDHEDDDHEHEGHADFNAKYQLQCQQPQALNIVSVQLFEPFKGIEKINAQWLTSATQSAKKLTPADRTINFQ